FLLSCPLRTFLLRPEAISLLALLLVWLYLQVDNRFQIALDVAEALTEGPPVFVIERQVCLLGQIPQFLEQVRSRHLFVVIGFRLKPLLKQVYQAVPFKGERRLLFLHPAERRLYLVASATGVSQA